MDVSRKPNGIFRAMAAYRPGHAPNARRDKEKREAPVSRGLSGERSEKPQGGGPRKPLGGFLRSRTA